MNLDTAIASLDKECDALLSQIDLQRPDDTIEAFALLRAKSLGRSLLRAAQAAGVTSANRLDAFYKGARGRAISADDGQQQG